MKPIFTTLFLLSIQFLQAQQTITIGGSGAFQSNNSVAVKKGIAIGQQAPDIKFSGLLNAPKDETSLSELKGKIVILEFWATWCVPCLPAMDHLKELKDKFPGNLVVIGILYDKTERLERYIKNKPSSLWHIADPESRFNEFFPHRSVPHSVIIDQSGKVVAITAPENITEKVISDLVRNQPVQLPEKEDHVGENFEPSKDYFPKDENAGYSFDIYPPIAGGFAMAKRRMSGPWKDRRLTLINSPLVVIYRSIYNINSMRMVYEGLDETDMKGINQKDVFCIDITVPKGKEGELFSYAQDQLSKLDLPVRVRIEKRKVKAAILTCTNPEKMQPSKEAPTTQKSGPMIQRATEFNKNAITVDEFTRSYLEAYGFTGAPVVNETGLTGLYDFNVSLDMEDKESLRKALANLGLKIIREEREIEMLVLYKE